MNSTFPDGEEMAAAALRWLAHLPVWRHQPTRSGLLAAMLTYM